MVTIKELEKKRINKIKSLNNDEIKEYLAVIYTDLMKITDVDNVTAVSDPNIFTADVDDLYSKLDEVSDLLGDKFNIDYAIKTTAYNFESISHVGTKIKYTSMKLELKIILISEIFKNILINYVHLKKMVDNYYILLVNHLDLDTKVSPELSADVVSSIEVIKSNTITMFNNDIADAVDDITANIDYIDKLFYSDEVLDNDIAEMKATIKDINDSDDYKNQLFKRIGVLDAVIGLLHQYQYMKELKNTYSDIKSDIDDLLNKDNIFLVYSYERFNNPDDAVGFTEFLKSEPKFNIKKSELVLP